MEIRQLRGFLLDRGMLYIYGVFIAGFFLLPMAGTLRKLFYIVVLPATLLLWRELAAQYRDNQLVKLLLAYAAWMMLTLAWTEDFDLAAAGMQFWLSANLLAFFAITGYVWINYPKEVERFSAWLVWLAAAAACVSIVAWYARNPFPGSRLVPLGVMHHQNKSGAAYGLFMILSMQLAITDHRRRKLFVLAGAVLGLLVLFTQSRTALAAACVGIVVMIGWRALIPAAVAVAASWILLASTADEWWHRVSHFSFRPGIWQAVMADMPGHWLQGRGYLTDPHVQAYDRIFDHAHNGYLATLRDGGLIGLGLLLAMLGTALHWAVRIHRDRGERIYLALLLYGMTCIFMDFDRLLVQPKEMWLYLWLPLALVAAAYSQRAGTNLPRFPMGRRPS